MTLAVGVAIGTDRGWSNRARARQSGESSSGDDSPAASDEFDPAVHGFGFSNWEGNTGTGADGEEFTYEPADVTMEDVQRSIDDSWTTVLSEARKALLTRIVYSWIGGQTATNGHCYGMMFAADEFFHHPSRLPDGVDAASEVPHPTGEYAAVGDRIRLLQSSQLLYAESYWFILLGLRWGLADHRESIEQVIEAIDATGTGGLALDGEAIAHQVLAYDYERSGDVTDVFVYDPNYQAEEHQDPEDVWRLSVDDRGTVHEIADGYAEFLYHDPDMGLSAVDRLIGDRTRVLDRLSNAVFLGLERGTALTVDVPDDVLVDRPTAEYADQDRAPYADAAVVLGQLDEFEVAVDGEAGSDFSLDTLGTRDGDVVLDEVVSDSLGEIPTRLRFAIDEAGALVVEVVEDVETEAAEAAEEAGEAAEEAEEAAETAAEAAEAAVEETDDVAEKRTETGPGGANDGAGWSEDEWLLAAAGGALGIGAAYGLYARRSDDGN